MHFRIHAAPVVALTVILGALAVAPSAASAQVIVQQQQGPVVQQSPARPVRTLVSGGEIGVPVFANFSGVAPNPGITFNGRAGWEFGNVTVFGVGALQFNWYPVSGSNILWNLTLGLGGRYSFYSDSPFVPFVALGAEIYFWFVPRASDIYVTAGPFAQLGLAMELSAAVAIEISLQTNFSVFSPSRVLFNGGAEMWLTPMLGLTFYQ